MASDQPRPRKTLIVLSDAEWRQLRIAAAAHDTTIQGWLTTAVLAALQKETRHVEAALVDGRSSGHASRRGSAAPFSASS